jgi:hypothetical protein
MPTLTPQPFFMAVSDVASVLLQQYGFVGKIAKNGTIGFNEPGLNDHQVQMLVRFALDYKQGVSIKRSGTGLRITLTPDPDQRVGDTNFVTLTKNGGFNISKLSPPEFLALLAFRRILGVSLTLKRSGTGIRVTLGPNGVARPGISEPL